MTVRDLLQHSDIECIKVILDENYDTLVTYTLTFHNRQKAIYQTTYINNNIDINAVLNSKVLLIAIENNKSNTLEILI